MASRRWWCVRFPAKRYAPGQSTRSALGGAFYDQFALELGQAAQHRQDQASLRRGNVSQAQTQQTNVKPSPLVREIDFIRAEVVFYAKILVGRLSDALNQSTTLPREYPWILSIWEQL